MQNTCTYFGSLMEAMGKNAKFAIDDVSQGVEPTVAVMWHLGKILCYGIQIKSDRQSGKIMIPSYCLLQSGTVRSSPLPRAAPSMYVQEAEQRFLLGC